MTATNNRRRLVRVVLPSVQLRLAVAVFLSCLGALSLNFLLIVRGASRLAENHPGLPESLQRQAVQELTTSLWVSAGLLLPLSFLVGVHVSGKFAGPLYRMKLFLEQIIGGQGPEDVKLRDRDQLQELRRLLNEATAEQRQRNRGETGVERDAA